MATYSSFKRVTSDAILNSTITGNDIASNTIPNSAIGSQQVPAGAMSGTVSSSVLASTIDLSSRTVTYRPIVDADISGSAGITGTTLGSGAITTNLGYTPINNTGDTVSGQLFVPAGSTAAPSIALSSMTDNGINFTGTTVQVVSDGAVSLNVDGSGFITRPNHPAFCAVGQNGWYYVNTWGPPAREVEIDANWNWAVAYQSGGSNFSTPGGRYTAPVAGHYAFQTWWYMLNDANTPPNYVHLFVRKNNNRGWTAGGRSPYIMHMHQNANGHDDGWCQSAVMPLAAGDFVSLACVFHGNSSRLHAGHQIFSGYLIG